MDWDEKTKDLLFMRPFLKEVLWGGTALRDRFGYDIPSSHTGEAWVISGHPAGPSVIAGGEYAGMTLEELWRVHGELFGRGVIAKKGTNQEDFHANDMPDVNTNGSSCEDDRTDGTDGTGGAVRANGTEGGDRTGADTFPLLVKLIDAGDDLSIQVHPDDAYAREHENGSSGKTECWYVVDCKEGADIIIGHHAQSKEELKRMITEKRWSDLLCVRPIRKGDFFFIPSGTVHAIRKGTILLEVQQNCDLTYRLYDYDRLQNGKPRELHIEKAEDVITCPQSLVRTEQPPIHIPGGERQILVDSEKFTVEKWTIRTADDVEIENRHSFLLCDIIEGTGRICGREVKAGDHFIVPFGFGDLAVSGKMTMIASYVCRNE